MLHCSYKFGIPMYCKNIFAVQKQNLPDKVVLNSLYK